MLALQDVSTRHMPPEIRYGAWLLLTREWEYSGFRMENREETNGKQLREYRFPALHPQWRVLPLRARLLERD